MNYLDTDTIAAIATPMGEGAISVIRISGPQSFDAIDSIFVGKNKISESKTHTIHYGKIFSKDGVIDDVLVSVFKGRNSYTGEDSIEISAHGSVLICQKIITELIGFGLRLAEPGEFTKRAFLNGRLDLVQAEAVADVIHSRTEASLRGARDRLDGLLSQKVNTLRNLLINTSSMVELELDFAEEDLEFISLDEVKKNIVTALDEINNLLKTFSFGKVLRDGVSVAIVGEPNVGKSSLLNYILKESRAIVSEIPGTTRDIIREEVSIDGFLFKLFDTAGIRYSADIIEKEGVDRSRMAVKNADLVVFLNDVQNGISKELFKQLIELISEERIITVLNKIDLIGDSNIECEVKISALTGEGLKLLLEKLINKAVGAQSFTEKSAVVSNIRHYASLKRAGVHLEQAVESIKNKLSGEFIAVDIRNAEIALGEIIGKVTTDDILDNIFSKFCIGK